MNENHSDDSAMEILSGIEGAFLNLETAATLMHVGVLHRCDAPPDYRGAIRASVGVTKVVAQRARSVIPTDLPLPADVPVSDVLGVRVPLSIAEHGLGVNITLMTYADSQCLGFAVARCAVLEARARQAEH